MRKTAQRTKENASENQEVSPPKKAKLKENKTTKEGTQVVASNRLPRAAKNRATVQANNNVETTKPRARAKAATLRRSNSSGDIAPSIATGKLKKTKSKSAEHLQQGENPPAKKSKNVAVKPAKKTVPKKAGNGAKANPRKKASKGPEPEELDEEPEVPQVPFIAKKAYSKTAAKKAPPVETKEDTKPNKRMPVKAAVVAAPKTTRGRGKQALADNAEEETPVESAKPLKGRRGKANEKNVAPESDEENVENVAEEVENTEDAAKAMRGKKGPAAAKKPRGKKVTSASNPAGDPGEDDQNGIPAQEPDENKLAKAGKKGKSVAVVKNRGKAAVPFNEDDDSSDKVADYRVENAEEPFGTPDKLPKVPEESTKPLKNGKTNSIEASSDGEVTSP